MKVKELFKVLEETKFSSYSSNNDRCIFKKDISLKNMSISGSYFVPKHNGYIFKFCEDGNIKTEKFSEYHQISESILEREVIFVEEINIFLEEHNYDCSIIIQVGS